MNDKTRKRKNGVITLVVACIVPCIVAMAIKMLMPTPNDDAYCDQMLKETGLDFSQMSFSIEHKFCEDRWIDAQVYFKLKVKGEDTDKVTNRLRS